ncbi:YibE/F family protein [Vagococcus sp.]|uniref:YibE/F family protein n=1 Tax=Vagococcus sp. TaxID=1933889 RepID=UPI003F9A1C45
MTVNFILFIILAGLMLLIAGRRGLTALIALILNLALMFIGIVLIRNGFSIIGVTLSASLLISMMNLFFINGYTQKTKIAFISSLCVVLMLIGLIFFSISIMHLQGLPQEELMEMDMYSLQIGTNFTLISVAVLIMSVIGAVNDVAISITSSMAELKITTPELSTQQWYSSGIKIGKDVLSATLNTLIFAIVGSQLALFIWITDLNYSFSQIFNTKIMVSELVSLLISAISITLTVPITAKLMARTKK